MVFTSLNFMIFFPVVVGIYFMLPNRFRWLHLLVASYYFYMSWKPVYALLLFFSTLTFYLAALGVEKFRNKGIWEKLFFFSGIAVNLGMLFAFKYYNFFEEQARALGINYGIDLHLPALDVLLPMGISFYTFQGISYLVDVYRRQLTAEHHFGLMLLYKAYFPLLVAGPIERGIHFIPQLRKVLLSDNAHRIRFEYERVVSGLRLMLLGFFKKIVLADNFAMIVQPVYAAPDEFSGTSALVATLAFAFQIFFDFSAYTDIARGVSRVLGFEMIENFNRPYFATSIPDFWRRWHISLSSWFSRLSLCAARRQPCRHVAMVPEPVDRLHSLRILARRELDLPRVGGSARPLLFPDLRTVSARRMGRCTYRALAVPESLPRYSHHDYVRDGFLGVGCIPG